MTTQPTPIPEDRELDAKDIAEQLEDGITKKLEELEEDAQGDESQREESR